jgi:carbamoyl-phosphate synthase large subunit
MIGVDVNAINITENREQFKQLLKKIGVPSAPAEICTSYLRGKEIAQEFGFPLVIRPSFTLEVQERLLCIKKKILMCF